MAHDYVWGLTLCLSDLWTLGELLICAPGDLESQKGHWIQQTAGRETPVCVFYDWIQTLQTIPSWGRPGVDIPGTHFLINNIGMV